MGTLDLVVTNANYHDTVWLEVDRDAMNRRVFAALKPGGHYVVIDTSAKDGSGVSDVKTLHRIDEVTVRTEVERAGFVLERSEDALRNPRDPRDWNVSPSAAGERRGSGDRFMLIFVKR
jgi:predicted methyltransferase